MKTLFKIIFFIPRMIIKLVLYILLLVLDILLAVTSFLAAIARCLLGVFAFAAVVGGIIAYVMGDMSGLYVAGLLLILWILVSVGPKIFGELVEILRKIVRAI